MEGFGEESVAQPTQQNSGSYDLASFTGESAAPADSTYVAPAVNGTTPPAAPPASGAFDMPAPTEPGFTNGGTPPVDATPLREWESAHELELQEKARKEEEQKKANREKAQKEMNQWYAERKQMMEQRKQLNRSEQTTLTQDKDGGEPWERVNKLVNFGSEGGQRDTSRMKQLLIQVKNNPLPAA